MTDTPISSTEILPTDPIPLGPPNWCDVDRQLGLFYWNYLQPISIGIAAFCLLPFFYLYIQAFMTNQFKSSKGQFYTGLIFFISIWLSLIFYIPCLYYYCWDPFLNNIFGIIVTQGYAIQTIMLLGIWSHRLFTLLKATQFEIPKVVMIPFFILYIITSISFASGGVFFQLLLHSIGPFLFSLGFILVFIMTFFLVTMFIYKIFKAYQETKAVSNDANTRLIQLITKTTLLAGISTTFVFFSCISSFLLPQVNSPHMIMVFTWALSIDMTSNFMCVYLSYHFNDELYVKVCGKCDAGCVRLWNRAAGDGEAELERIKSSRTSTMKSRSSIKSRSSYNTPTTQMSQSGPESPRTPGPASPDRENTEMTNLSLNSSKYEE